VHFEVMGSKIQVIEKVGEVEVYSEVMESDEFLD